jgi:hypothetical protein
MLFKFVYANIGRGMETSFGPLLAIAFAHVCMLRNGSPSGLFGLNVCLCSLCEGVGYKVWAPLAIHGANV